MVGVLGVNLGSPGCPIRARHCAEEVAPDYRFRRLGNSSALIMHLPYG